MTTVIAMMLRAVTYGLLAYVNTYLLNRHRDHFTMQNRLQISSLQYTIICGVCLAVLTCKVVIRTVRSSKRYQTLNANEDGVVELMEAGAVESLEKQSEVEESPSPQGPSLSEETFTRSEMKEEFRCIFLMGVLVWGSMYCMDFMVFNTSLNFVTGILMGWLFTDNLKHGNVIVNALYTVLLTGLLILPRSLNVENVLSHPRYENEGFNIVVFHDILIKIVIPLMIGYLWTGYLYTMPRKTTKHDITDASYVCALLCWGQQSSINFALITEKLAVYDQVDLMLLFVIEPFLKFMAIYLILISVQVGQKLELISVLAVVVNLRLLLLPGVSIPDITRQVMISFVVLLSGTHCIMSFRFQSKRKPDQPQASDDI